MSSATPQEDPLDAAFEEQYQKEAAERAAALRKVYIHYFFCCCQTVMPFSQKSNLIMALPEFAGDVRKVGLFTASMASSSGITEFVLCPFLGKLSDSNGRKAFMKLGPLADLICYGMVYANPSSNTLWLQALAGAPLNTFSGTTCAGASIADIFADAPDEMGPAYGGLLSPIGAGLIIGPLIGQAFVKLGGGRPEYAYLGASCCAAVQLLNVQSMQDTLPKDKLKPFEFSLSMINPLSFLSLFCMKGQSVLARLALMTGFLQKADEGKNLADLHQIYAMKDVGMSPEARGNFVSAIGACVLLSVRMCKLTMAKLGGHGHTTLSNMICIGSLFFFATVPRMFKKSAHNWWPMFLGILISSLGWNADTYVKQQATVHAQAANIGNAEFSAMTANMRSVMSTLAPTLYARVYAWSTSGGRQMPGLAYIVSALFKVLAELTYQSMSCKQIENPPASK
jgi:MFS family permease